MLLAMLLKDHQKQNGAYRVLDQACHEKSNLMGTRLIQGPSFSFQYACHSLEQFLKVSPVKR